MDHIKAYPIFLVFIILAKPNKFCFFIGTVNFIEPYKKVEFNVSALYYFL